MRKITLFIITGFIGFTSFAAHAQSPSDLEAALQSLGNAASITDLMQGVMDSSAPVEFITIIDAPLVVEAGVPEVNQTIAPAYVGGAQAGRYAPRLKIDFAEFPLRSFTSADRAETEQIVLQRIQSRLRVHQINLVVQDRTAIVSGRVATERQRSLGEAMLRFEPGIDSVQNQITVTP